VLALESTSAERQPFAGLVDLSLWPDDGRVRAPGARSKPGACSKPYVLNLCIDPAYRRRGLARALMALCERVVRDVWVDSVMLLHVEDDKVPANTMYENMNYSPVKYTFDQEFPYSKAEAKVLGNVTWRRKLLPPPSASAPIVLGLALPEEAAPALATAPPSWEDMWCDEDEEVAEDEEEEE
ncbi:unnamed protein product, partial [Polarella glacialis]